MYYNNAYYARVGGITNSEVNSLEMELLRMISFSLFVQPQQYERYRGSLYSHLPQMTQSVPVPVPVPVPAEAHVDVAQSHACGAYAAAACGGAGGAGVPAGAPPALAQQAAGSGGPGHLRYE